MVDPLTTDQWVLWLPIAVTLATLLMDRAPGLVRAVGLGVGQLQLVKVKSLFTFHTHTYHSAASVSCGSPPSIPNGSPGTPNSTTFGGTVTYSCDPGYIMIDSTNNLVTCLSTGNWSAPPSCLSELLTGLPVPLLKSFTLQLLLQSTSLSPPPTICLVSRKSLCPLWERGMAVLSSVTQTFPPVVVSWTREWRGRGTIQMGQWWVTTQQQMGFI